MTKLFYLILKHKLHVILQLSSTNNISYLIFQTHIIKVMLFYFVEEMLARAVKNTFLT
jgi:hypothetical protein